MNTENVIAALENLASAHDIDPYVFGEALAESLRAAVIRQFETPDAYVALDLDSGLVHLEALPAEGAPITVTLADLGRRGAAAIKEAFDRTVGAVKTERLEHLLDEKSGQLVFGHITQASSEAAIVSLPDGVEGELLASNAPGIRFRPGNSVSAILTGDVDSSGGIPRARLTRRGNDFIMALLREAVPSVADGAIVVEAIARDPGNRTKILVRSENPEGPDPVGLIIGTKGATIRKITDETYPERIDVLSVGTLAEMVTAALAPGRVLKVEEPEGPEGPVVAWIRSEDRAATLGRGGSNLRLASAILGRVVNVALVDADSADSPAGDSPVGDSEADLSDAA